MNINWRTKMKTITNDDLKQFSKRSKITSFVDSIVPIILFVDILIMTFVSFGSIYLILKNYEII